MSPRRGRMTESDRPFEPERFVDASATEGLADDA